jgi:hypothetical protein
VGNLETDFEVTKNGKSEVRAGVEPATCEENTLYGEIGLTNFSRRDTEPV